MLLYYFSAWMSCAAAHLHFLSRKVLIVVRLSDGLVLFDLDRRTRFAAPHVFIKSRIDTDHALEAELLRVQESALPFSPF